MFGEAIAHIGLGALGMLAAVLLCSRAIKSGCPRRPASWLDVAVSHMTQGLLVFDAEERIVMCNDRYMHLYQLSPDMVRPGLPFRALIVHRKETGTFTGDVDTYRESHLQSMAGGAVSEFLKETSDGRIIRIVNTPIVGGGWVSTHEDVTESKQREASFRLLFEDNPLPMWVYDRTTLGFMAVNDAALQHYGYTRSSFFNMTVLDIHSAEERSRYLDSTRDRSTRMEDRPWLHQKSDGTEMEVVVYSQPLKYEGRDACLVGMIDVTRRNHAERQRDRDRDFLHNIIDHVPVMITVKSAADRRFVLANKAVETFWGISREEALGKTASELFSPAQAKRIDSVDDEVVGSTDPVILGPHPNMARSGSMTIVTSKRLAMRDADGKASYLISVVEDVTERRRAEERMERMAHFDALTGLANRARYREALDLALTEMGEQDTLAVLYLDLDNFKSINDTLGHPVGDELLQAVALRLQDAVIGSETIARLGGDEFAIIQRGRGGVTDATALAERLHEAIHRPYDIAGHRLLAGTSIGIALAPIHGRDADCLLKSADLAMYAAKVDGRGKYRLFEPGMDAREQARRALEIDLRQAIAAESLQVLYQPIVSVRDRSVTCCEALLRWAHPTLGSVPPGVFIPVAEDTGMICELGEWVLTAACMTAAAWPPHINVAVNISPVQFKSGNLVEHVVNALAVSGLSPKRLELEITEAVLIKDDEAVLTVLHQLRGLGVRIALDDFGTGYSSLSYLQRFPFDKIKIDRSFISGITKDAASQAIVQAVIGIAQSGNMKTTAEGVETAEQLSFLRLLACDEMQGYLFSPAVSPICLTSLFEQPFASEGAA